MEHENNSAAIQMRIDTAVAAGAREVLLCGNFTIDHAITLPSHITLILDGCHLRLADGTFCRMFVNQSVACLDAGDAPTQDHDIHIQGRNGATLDGGNYNGLSEWNYASSPYHISVNNLILFANVTNFSISGIRVVAQRWWALNFVNCVQGHLSHIHFEADDTRLLPDGTRVHGLTWEDYESTYIKNADGIDLRCGCHDILIEDITGFTEDDTIALTALHGSTEKRYAAGEVYDGIHHVTIRRVQAQAFCTIVRLLNQGGTRMHHITIEDVTDTADGTHMTHGLHAVRVGDPHPYGTPGYTPEDIIIRRIQGRAPIVLSLVGRILRPCIEDICGTAATQELIHEEDGPQL